MFSKSKRWIALVVVLCVAAAVFGYPAVRERFAPMSQHESQCLLCQRNRIEKWICEEKVLDSVETNEYSDWVDSVVNPEHVHVWAIATSYYRGSWFGPQSIGCGGQDTLARIFDLRLSHGEQPARDVLAKWHRLIQSLQADSEKFDKSDYDAMRDFREAVVKDPTTVLN
jgi:hypothetical protein